MIQQQWETVRPLTKRFTSAVRQMEKDQRPMVATFSTANDDVLIPLGALGVEPGMVAKHAAAKLIQYMVLQATTIDTDIVVEQLRTLALCWKEHRDQVRKIVSIINDIKERSGKSVTPGGFSCK